MGFGRRRKTEQSERIRELQAVRAEPVGWRAPWPLLTMAAAGVTALAGWLLVVGFCVLGWIQVPAIKPAAAVSMGCQGWLLANGVPVSLPGGQVSIMPLGLTGVICWVGSACLGVVAVRSRAPGSAGAGARVLRVGLVFSASYLAILAGVRLLVQDASTGGSPLFAALVFSLLLGLIGAARAHRWRPANRSHLLLTGLRAVTAGLAVLAITGALVFTAALWTGRERFIQIHDSLGAGGLGGVMLLLSQLAWLPNYIMWCGSWALGAGIQLGLQTVISPAQTTVGLLPAIPVLGAVPPAGPMPRMALWWLASGALAGIVSALIGVRGFQAELRTRSSEAGADLTAIVGAGIGMATGAFFTLLQIPAGGDLGAIRLVDLGARLGPLAIMAPTSLGLAGMATGWLLGWRAGRQPTRQAGDDPAAVAEAEVSTAVIDG